MSLEELLAQGTAAIQRAVNDSIELDRKYSLGTEITDFVAEILKRDTDGGNNSDNGNA